MRHLFRLCAQERDDVFIFVFRLVQAQLFGSPSSFAFSEKNCQLMAASHRPDSFHGSRPAGFVRSVIYGVPVALLCRVRYSVGNLRPDGADETEFR